MAIAFDSSLVSAELVKEACSRIEPYVHRTRVFTCDQLSQLATDASGSSRKLFLKAEHEQKVGAFKIRGAINAISLSTADYVVTQSSGNHAQAIALGCKLLGKTAVVVMPEDSPAVKVSAVRDTYGAEVRLCKPTQEAREAMSAEVVQELRTKHGADKAEEIHPNQDPRVVNGQGSVAVELLEQQPDLDAIVVSIGGGGLIAGIATYATNFTDCFLAPLRLFTEVVMTALQNGTIADLIQLGFADLVLLGMQVRHGLNSAPNIDFRSKQMDITKPNYTHGDFNFEALAVWQQQTKVIGAEPEAAKSAYMSKKAGMLVKNPPNTAIHTIADSVKSSLGPTTYPIVQELVDAVFIVSEQEIEDATKFVMERAKQVIEPGCGVAVAVATSKQLYEQFPDLRNIGVIMCGGNVDLTQLPWMRTKRQLEENGSEQSLKATKTQ
ncbi:unnamed protein product [Polarella glacialis]|uniref:Tryptophan synthase beta chain-like PALP domain-containing protein n=1 Tax=Polarella glacialis TaxID=89957 RepID=A0A813FWA5_POLGL|nr:unnamed protein product [Polarella glacialis]